MPRSPGNWVGTRKGRLTVWLELNDHVLIVDCDCGKRKTISKDSFYVAESCGCLQRKRASAGVKAYWKKWREEREQTN